MRGLFTIVLLALLAMAAMAKPVIKGGASRRNRLTFDNGVNALASVSGASTATSAAEPAKHHRKEGKPGPKAEPTCPGGGVVVCDWSTAEPCDNTDITLKPNCTSTNSHFNTTAIEGALASFYDVVDSVDYVGQKWSEVETTVICPEGYYGSWMQALGTPYDVDDVTYLPGGVELVSNIELGTNQFAAYVDIPIGLASDNVGLCDRYPVGGPEPSLVTRVAVTCCPFVPEHDKDGYGDDDRRRR